MKKPKEYLERLYITKDGEPESIHDSVENVLDVLKQIQLDAVEATCKRCAEEAMLGNTENGIYNVLEVSKDSILKVADKMKEELK
jgi:hypothetical protein